MKRDMQRPPAGPAASPLRIAELDLGSKRGRLGITLAPGKIQFDAMSGPTTRVLADDLDVIERWNASAVVTLLEDIELHFLDIPQLGLHIRERNMEWMHFPIRDGCAPYAESVPAWHIVSHKLHSLLDRGANILIHCKGGLGRAGMIAARLLCEAGEPFQSAVDRVRTARPGAIETADQLRWIRDVTRPRSQPPQTTRGRRDRAIGSLIGLALGDALGTTLEFEPRPDRMIVKDIVGGGPFNLIAGQWTDDTAMALALAESLLHDPSLDARDLMNRFSAWASEGRYSCTGTCFDIGTTVSRALATFRRTGDPFAGPADARSAGNGALMRLAPVAIRHWQDRNRRCRVAQRQTETTHRAREAVDASIYLADVIAGLISGADLLSALQPSALPLCDRIDRIRAGSWRGLDRRSVRADGYVVHSLEAAIWAVARTTSFRNAVVLAANLGEDADTVAAIAGQIAGALYGVSSFPRDWLSVLAWRDRFMDLAAQLYDAGERPLA